MDEKRNSIYCHLCDWLILSAYILLVLGTAFAAVMFANLF